MEDINVLNKIDKDYIKFFLSGYLNFYKGNLLLSGLNKWRYKQFKIKSALIYLGLPLKYKRLFEILSPIYLPGEFIFSLFILVYKYLISSFHALRVKKEMPVGKILMLALDIPLFKLSQILKCFPKDEEIKAVQIPFINSETPYDTYSMYSVVKFNDCGRALILSVRLLLRIFKKYHRYDFLFRAYAAYEFFLSCMYVEHSDESNQFLFVSMNDRWAYLIGNDTKHLNIFIQHGILDERIHYFKFKAPHTAFYINRQQQEFFERKMFIGKPQECNYRPCLEFTSNDKLRQNGNPNLLIICCNKYFELERVYIKQLAKNNKYNIYIKPHPGFKDYNEYYVLQKKYDFVILNKEDYPHVDIVLSYDSTLACEYEDVGVPVLRYCDTNFDEEFKIMVGA